MKLTMHIACSFILLGFLCGTSLLHAASPAAAAAGRLLEAMDMPEKVTDTAARTVTQLLEMEPAWGFHVDLVIEFVDEYMGWEALEPALRSAYAQVFTLGELRELTVFFNTPLGKKYTRQTALVSEQIQEALRLKITEDLWLLERRMKHRELDRMLESAVFAPEPEKAPDPEPRSP